MDPFITTQNLSDLLGIDVTADPAADLAVAAACDVVRQVTEQDFNYGTSTVSMDGTDTDALVLPNAPVANAGTVVLIGYGYGGYGYGYGYSSSGTITDYMVATDGTNRLMRGLPGAGVFRPVWPRGRQNVVVTFEHGYAPDDLPEAVQAVALQIASRMVVQGVAQAETIGDVSVTYAGPAGDLTTGEYRLLYGFLQRRSF
jgi:hypothetical protein